MSVQKQGDSMKKVLSFALAVALLVQSSGMQAFPQWQGSRAQQLKQQMGSGISSVLSKYIGQPGSEQAKKFMAWFGPFSSELKKAFKKGNYASMPGIVNKYRAQAAGSAIAVAVVIVITAVVAALVGRAVMGTTTTSGSVIGDAMTKFAIPKTTQNLSVLIAFVDQDLGYIHNIINGLKAGELSLSNSLVEGINYVANQLNDPALKEAAWIISSLHKTGKMPLNVRTQFKQYLQGIGLPQPSMPSFGFGSKKEEPQGV